MYGDDDIAITNALNNLGSIYTSMGKYDVALEYLNTAFEIY
jgi:hypothetical protein